MATTDRGLWYLTEADDSTVADLAEITEHMQDTVETALDEIDSEKMPAEGGTFTGDVSFETGGAFNRWTKWLKSGVRRWQLGFAASGDGQDSFALQRFNSAGGYVDQPWLVRADGSVYSSSHIGGVWTGALTDYVAGTGGSAPIGLPTSPTGRWSVVAMGANGAEALTVVISGNTAWVGVKSQLSASATIHWQAVAY